MTKIQVSQKEEITYTREDIRQFEVELAGRSFDTYCLDMGFRIYRKDFKDYFIVRSKIEEYQKAKEKQKLLEDLLQKRWYAQKIEHEKQFMGKNCEEKSLRKDRCTFCWPWTFREYCEANGKTELLQKYDRLKGIL